MTITKIIYWIESRIRNLVSNGNPRENDIIEVIEWLQKI